MPDIVLSAQDSDVIKTYVELGLGVGLVAEQSGDARSGHQRVRYPPSVRANTVWLGLKRGQLQQITFGALSNCAMPDCRWMRLKASGDRPEEAAIDYQI